MWVFFYHIDSLLAAISKCLKVSLTWVVDEYRWFLRSIESVYYPGWPQTYDLPKFWVSLCLACLSWQLQVIYSIVIDYNTYSQLIFRIEDF